MRSSIVAFLFLISLLFCSGEDDMDEAVRNMSFYGILLFMMTDESYVLSDNHDGTVSLHHKDGFGDIMHTHLYKKCLQGQVYRSAENDCRGAGTQADLWNASLLQYCNADDNTCNPTGQYVAGENKYVHGVNSQIWVSCDADTTNGLKWYPAHGVVTELFYNNALGSVYPDLPWNSNVGIWSAFLYYLDNSKARFYTLPYDKYSTADPELKTAQKYVLCGTSIPG